MELMMSIQVGFGTFGRYRAGSRRGRVERRKPVPGALVQRGTQAWWLAACSLLLSGLCGAAMPQPAADGETRYLVFQMFTVVADPAVAMGATTVLKDFPDRQTMQSFVSGLKDRIGSVGDKLRKLGFAVGRIALDHSVTQVWHLIRDAFAVARSLDMAVALHIDDAVFWTLARRIRASRTLHSARRPPGR